MFKPILVWFGFLTVVRYQTLFLEEAKDISKFLSGTLQSKGPLKIQTKQEEFPCNAKTKSKLDCS